MLISTNSGLHSGRKGKVRYPMLETIDFIADAGFEAVDLSFCATTYREAFKHEPILDGDWKANLTPVLERIKTRGLVITYSHTPFFDYFEKENPDYEFRCQMIHKSIEAAAFCGCQWTVIHCVKNPVNGVVEDSIEVLKPYLETAHRFNIGLAVENSLKTTENDLLEICNFFHNDHIGVCWDIGHANVEPYIDPAQGIMNLGKTLKVTHLHDNYGIKDNHGAPYFGKINWDAVTRALLTSGYEGAFNYEVNVTSLPEGVRKEFAEYLVAVAKDLISRNS